MNGNQAGEWTHVCIPFYGTKHFCHTYLSIDLGRCDEESDEEGNKQKEGYDSIVLS